MRILTFPGVFQPRSDTWLLAEALRAQDRLRDGHVLDLCTGSGALAVTAACHGAREVVAVDLSRRSVLTARVNALINGVRIRAVRGSLFEAVGDRRFDLVVSNPPYVPADRDELPTAGPQRAWDAGVDGRALLDPICDQVARHLRPGGTVLLVHSSVCGEELTLRRLRAGGLEASVLQRRAGPRGPLLSARAETMEERGLLVPGSRTEELVVIGGTRAQQ
jgi:release factor glutamine methyltransferase